MEDKTKKKAKKVMVPIDFNNKVQVSMIDQTIVLESNERTMNVLIQLADLMITAYFENAKKKVMGYIG